MIVGAGGGVGVGVGDVGVGPGVVGVGLDVTLKPFVVVEVGGAVVTLLDAAIVYPFPALCSFRPEKLATPLTAFTVRVPLRVPDEGLLDNLMVTLPLKAV